MSWFKRKAQSVPITDIECLAARNPQLIIIRSRPLQREMLDSLRVHWKQAVAGTALEHVKVVVLPDSCHVQIVDQEPDGGLAL